MARPVVALLTDFGLRDSYVAEMKGVILSICPVATIADVSHQIEKFNIRMGAYVLACAAPYFPRSTIFVAVVDPGVGTRRKAILIQTKQAYFIGPDNGVLALAVANQGIERVHEISNKKLLLPDISNTFHGRDVFAPAAAHLANGTPPANFGPETRMISTPSFAKVVKKRNMLVSEVLHVDEFGNIVTNIQKRELGKISVKEILCIKLKSIKLKLSLCRAYAEVERQKPLAIIGSHGFLEVSMNEGNAAEVFKIRSGDKITLYHS